MPTSEPVSTVEPGTVLAGDYRIVRLISEGGMGAVYLAEQLSTGKQRALKLMLRALAADPVFRKRFEHCAAGFSASSTWLPGT